MSHTCQALVIHCMDFRFHTAIRDFLVSLGLKNQYDLVSLAGATKCFSSKDENDSQVLILKQIETSWRLHGICQVYLIHHIDCGAYGDCAAFKNSREEHDQQSADMEKAKQVIQQKFPKLTVKKVLARIEEKAGENVIDFEVIN